MKKREAIRVCRKLGLKERPRKELQYTYRGPTGKLLLTTAVPKGRGDLSPYVARKFRNQLRRIIEVLAWSTDESDTPRRVIGAAARWSLTSNAVDHDRVLDICRAELGGQRAHAAAVLADVIQQAEKKRGAD